MYEIIKICAEMWSWNKKKSRHVKTQSHLHACLFLARSGAAFTDFSAIFCHSWCKSKGLGSRL